MRGSIVGLVLLGGCTFGRLDGLTGGSGLDASDGGAGTSIDGGAPAAEAGTRTDAGDAGATVLLSDTFDDTATCTGTSFNSTLTPSTNGRGDAHACKVCSQGTVEDSFSYNLQVFRASSTVGTVGTHFHATAWYRNAQTSASADSVTFALRSFVPQPFTQVELVPAFGRTSGDWQRIDTDLVVTKTTATALDFFLSEPAAAANICFIMDDLEITRLD